MGLRINHNITSINAHRQLQSNDSALASTLERLVQTTEANLGEVSSLLTNIRQLAIHAANEGVNDETMLEADQLEIENALATIDRISNQAQFGTKKTSRRLEWSLRKHNRQQP